MIVTSQDVEEEKIWETHEDDEGNKYYWNSQTGESSWTISEEGTNERTTRELDRKDDEGYVTETTDGSLTEATTTLGNFVRVRKSREGRREVLPFSTDEALSSGYTTEETYRP